MDVAEQQSGYADCKREYRLFPGAADHRLGNLVLPAGQVSSESKSKVGCRKDGVVKGCQTSKLALPKFIIMIVSLGGKVSRSRGYIAADAVQITSYIALIIS